MLRVDEHERERDVLRQHKGESTRPTAQRLCTHLDCNTEGSSRRSMLEEEGTGDMADECRGGVSL